MSHLLECRLNRPWEAAADHNLFQAPQAEYTPA